MQTLCMLSLWQIHNYTINLITYIVEESLSKWQKHYFRFIFLVELIISTHILALVKREKSCSYSNIFNKSDVLTTTGNIDALSMEFTFTGPRESTKLSSMRILNIYIGYFQEMNIKTNTRKFCRNNKIVVVPNKNVVSPKKKVKWVRVQDSY